MFVNTGRSEDIPYICVSSEDVWDLDKSLAKVIATSLKAFKEAERKTAPNEIFKKYSFSEKQLTDDQLAFDFLIGIEEEEIARGLSSAEWEGIIDKMILAFDYIARGEIIGTDYTISVGVRDATKEGVALFAKYYGSLWT